MRESWLRVKEQSRVKTRRICLTVCLLPWKFVHNAKNTLQQTAHTHTLGLGTHWLDTESWKKTSISKSDCMAKMTCGSWVCCSQENKRPVIRWALVSQSHHHVPGGCLLAQTQFVTSFDNLFECPKLWPLHLLWKTEGFGVAVPGTPYLLLSLVYLNTSGALQGCLPLFFLFVCFGYCFSAIPPKSTTGDYSTQEGKHMWPAFICPAVCRGQYTDLQVE